MPPPHPARNTRPTIPKIMSLLHRREGSEIAAPITRAMTLGRNLKPVNDLHRPNVPESCTAHLKPTIHPTSGFTAIRCQREDQSHFSNFANNRSKVGPKSIVPRRVACQRSDSKVSGAARCGRFKTVAKGEVVPGRHGEDVRFARRIGHAEGLANLLPR